MMKAVSFFTLITFLTQQIAWAEEPVPIPCVAQLPPEGLRPVTNPVTDPNSLIVDKPNLPGLPSGTGFGFPQTSQKFLEGGSPLSPPDVQPVPPFEDKPFQFTGFSNSIYLIPKKEKKEEEASSEKHPGITTGNLKDLVVDDSTLIWDPPFLPEDFRPVVEPKFNIEFRKPFDQDPLPGPLVNPALLKPPSLLQGEEVKIDVSLPEPPPLEKPVPLIEKRSFSGNAGTSFIFSKKKEKTEKTARKEKVRKRNGRERKWTRGGDGKE